MIGILFVCHGNICRSPMAELILKDMVQKRGIADRFMIDSAATSDEEILMGCGNPVYPPARAELKRHGIDCGNKRARQIRREEKDTWDLILYMDRENGHALRRLFGGLPEHVKPLMSFTGSDREVADPWYTGRFDETWRDLEEGCGALLNLLTGKNNECSP